MKSETNRRSFLKAMGVGAAAMTLPGSVRAQDPGQEVSDGPYKVLEIFLHGGLSHRDTLWLHTNENPCVGSGRSTTEDPCGFRSGGKPAYEAVRWNRLHDEFAIENVPAEPQSLSQGDATCSPALTPLTQVNWDLKWRVVATRHDEPALWPHEPAAALALTGSRNGRADQAGMGAAVLAARESTAGKAFVFHCGGNELQASFAAKTGLHGSQNRPIVVRMGDANLLDRLDRAATASSAHQRLADALRDRYGDRLVHYGNHAVRSDAFAEYQATNDVLGNGSLASWLRTTGLNIHDDSLEGQVRGMIEGGIALLDGDDTEYVCAITPNPLDPEDDFDTHGLHNDDDSDDRDRFVRHAEIHNLGLYIILDAIVQGLSTAARRDEILVVVHSEFGRSPDGTDFTNHWPNGGATLFIGGPTQSGSVGSIGTDEYATNALTPRDIRCALYQAMDIDPFGEHRFTPDSVLEQRATTESGAALRANLHSLGGLDLSSVRPDDLAQALHDFAFIRND